MYRGIVMPTLAMLGAALGGCLADANSDGGILVLSNIAADEECQTSASGDEPVISSGTLDPVRSSDYLFIAQLTSRISALEGTEQQRTIITRGANIDVSFPGSTLFSDAELAQMQRDGVTRYRQLFSAPIAPNGGLTDVGFHLITGPLAATVRAKAGTAPVVLLASFIVDGDMSGAKVVSQQFSYPVTLQANSSIRDRGACSLLPDGFTANEGYACNPAQDGFVDCCTSGNQLICPAQKL